MWNVLESAFGEQGYQLLRYLVEYEPAKQLGFSSEELHSLLILRGRASHAAGREGIEEIRKVTQEASEKLPRLKCLVEQVLLTKQKWGVKSGGTDRLARLAAYTKMDGSLVLYVRK